MSKPIQLDSEHDKMVEGLVSTGRYSSAEEVVTAGLELLTAREARLAELRAAWDEGVASGDYQPIDDVLDELAERYATMAKAVA